MAFYLERAQGLIGPFVERTKSATITRLRQKGIPPSENLPVVPDSFDEQFANVHTIDAREKFPRPIRWVYAQPDEPTDKPTVAVVCGFNESPDDAKGFMQHLVKEGWPVLSMYNFSHAPGSLPSASFPEVILQKALATKLVVEAATDEYAVDSLHLFGHSMGAPVGALAAALTPDRYASFTAYAPAGMVGADSRKKLIRLDFNRELAERVSSIRYSLLHPIQAWREGGGIAQMQIDTLLPLLREMGIPTYGIFGSDDVIVPKQALQLFPADFEIRQFDEVHEIPGGKHSDLIDHPDKHIGVFMNFLLQAEQRIADRATATTIYSAS